jgi:gamma-glutamyltranspeptidase/glutathione hydrolase
VVARHGMVVAQEARAARIGAEILERGGNAVDAAVATGFALAVTYPRAGNIGGGGYMVIHLAAGRDTTIDYRETAPAAITRESFLDANGAADAAKSRDSALAIGVPGTVAGLALAHASYGSGRFTFAELLEPAITLARAGFPVADDLADSLPSFQRRLARWPSSARIFFHDGRVLGVGEMLVQGDLADTLAAIARADRLFVKASRRIAAAVRQAGGVMSGQDLRAYRPLERAPLRGSYRGYDVVAMPPSSSGGVVLLEMLNILEGYQHLAADEALRLHLGIEAMKLAYADRAAFLGDPATVEAPLARLLSKSYAAQLRRHIEPEHARPAADIRGITERAREGSNTTHFSVVDRFGNAVITPLIQFQPRCRAYHDHRVAQQRVDDSRLSLTPQRVRPTAGEATRPDRLNVPLVDVADHPAQGGTTVPCYRLAGRQPHHYDGTASDLQRGRPGIADRRRGGSAAAA